MGDLITARFPWEPVKPASTEETVAALQRDMAYIVAYTAVVVHSTRDELRMVVNVRRGQIVPRGECSFTDGSTFELQDIGAPQIGADEMTVKGLMAKVFEIATGLGLELA